MPKKLSIITICFNIKNEIEQTLKSIVNQTWQDFEWIVIDGGSTDGTLDILKKYKKHMTVLISEPDKGIYNAMNKGIKIAKGKYLNFMNGGDSFYADDVLEKVFAGKNYDADVLYGDYNIICPSGKSQIRIFPETVDSNFFIDDCISHQGAFIKHQLFDKYGLYNEDFRIVSDWEKWVIYSINNCDFQHLNLVVANFMRNGISSTQTELLMRERYLIHKKYCKTQKIYYLFNIIPLLKIETSYY